MVNRLLSNKSTSFAVFIGALVVYLLFVSYITTSNSVSAVFDPEVVEQAKDRFPDTSKPSERSISPSPSPGRNLICDDPIHGNGGSCDTSRAENTSRYSKAPDGTFIVEDNSDSLQTKVYNWATSIRWQDWLIIGGFTGLALLSIGHGIRALLREYRKPRSK